MSQNLEEVKFENKKNINLIKKKKLDKWITFLDSLAKLAEWNN